jgi:hypothetical protein
MVGMSKYDLIFWLFCHLYKKKGFWIKLDRMDLAENDICCRVKHNAVSEGSVFFPIRAFLFFETYQVGLPHV